MLRFYVGTCEPGLDFKWEFSYGIPRVGDIVMNKDKKYEVTSVLWESNMNISIFVKEYKEDEYEQE